jgi:hypothetical protein
VKFGFLGLSWVGLVEFSCVCQVRLSGVSFLQIRLGLVRLGQVRLR